MTKGDMLDRKGTFKDKLVSFGDNPTDYNYMALLVCILNPRYSVNDALVAVGVIESRENFEGGR